MQLYFDQRDDRTLEQRGLRTLFWLDDLGAEPIQGAPPGREGFLFAGARSLDDYRELVAPHPALLDRPEARAPLLRLDALLARLGERAGEVDAPRTWRLGLDQPLPDDLTFPLFLRTGKSSWKLGGGAVSRVEGPRELAAEAAALRRAFGWDELILAREWLELAPAGRNAHGEVPQEVRAWVVDGVPLAWSFHHMAMASEPMGFPPEPAALVRVAEIASRVAEVFDSRLVVVDVARCRDGRWAFIEAGPGSCAGTAHEGVFKAVASRLLGEEMATPADALGGRLPTA